MMWRALRRRKRLFRYALPVSWERSPFLGIEEDEVGGGERYETEYLGAGNKAVEANAKREAASCESARSPMDLSGVPLHDLIPGLEFLPGIETLGVLEVRSVQIEYVRASLLSAQCTIDGADNDLDKNYMAHGDPEMYVWPSPFATDTQKQDISDVLAEGDIEHEIRSQAYHISPLVNQDNEHDQAVYFSNPTTCQGFGSTAMNYLLNSPERQPQIYHAVEDFDDEDLEVAELDVSTADTELSWFASYFDDYQPDGVNRALHEIVSEDDEDEQKTMCIPDDMQPMMYSRYYEPPHGSKSIYREPPEHRGPMRRPGWKPLHDTLL